MTSFLYKNKKIAGVSFQVSEKNAKKPTAKQLACRIIWMCLRKSDRNIKYSDNEINEQEIRHENVKRKLQ